MIEDNGKNKRIAKNTFYLYIRMLFSMVISLYTSRVVLNTLGVEDFGIYNVVAGVISMFSFLNTSMSGAVSRFFAYAIGTNNWKHIQNTFSSALTIHLIIALFIMVLSETVGLWFLQNKLVIPENRILAANIIYQFSILTSMIAIIQVPYVAMIMAYERMSVYACIEIINVLLKLVIVILLIYITFDKLIIYGLLLLISTLIISVIYGTYCTKKIESCRFCLLGDKKLIYSMFTFSGWDLYGNASVLARTQGVNILLNMFFGAVLNAASGIASQIQTAVMSFAGSVLSAVRPQMIKSYAVGDYNRMIYLIYKASIYTSILLLLFTIPLLIETDFILALWLSEVPIYAGILCRYVLLFNLFANLSSVVVSAIHATGKIKRPSLINGTFYLSVIPFAYIAFYVGSQPQLAYIYNIFAVLAGLLSNVWTLHLYIPCFSFKQYAWLVLCRTVCVGSLTFFATYFFSKLFDAGWIRLICVGLFSTILLLVTTYFILMTNRERKLLKLRLL